MVVKKNVMMETIIITILVFKVARSPHVQMAMPTLVWRNAMTEIHKTKIYV